MTDEKYPVVFCPYCHERAKIVFGTTIYPHRPDLADKMFYQCAPCDAYVGCHPNTDRPLGQLANAELRKVRREAHMAFDPIWKNKLMSRTRAYDWLSRSLGIPKHRCHIGMFDVDLCKKTVEVCRSRNVTPSKKNQEITSD